MTSGCQQLSQMVQREYGIGVQPQRGFELELGFVRASQIRQHRSQRIMRRRHIGLRFERETKLVRRGRHLVHTDARHAQIVMRLR